MDLSSKKPLLRSDSHWYDASTKAAADSHRSLGLESRNRELSCRDEGRLGGRYDRRADRRPCLPPTTDYAALHSLRTSSGQRLQHDFRDMEARCDGLDVHARHVSI